MWTELKITKTIFVQFALNWHIVNEYIHSQCMHKDCDGSLIRFGTYGENLVWTAHKIWTFGTSLGHVISYSEIWKKIANSNDFCVEKKSDDRTNPRRHLSKNTLANSNNFPNYAKRGNLWNPEHSEFAPELRDMSQPNGKQGHTEKTIVYIVYVYIEYKCHPNEWISAVGDIKNSMSSEKQQNIMIVNQRKILVYVK